MINSITYLYSTYYATNLTYKTSDIIKIDYQYLSRNITKGSEFSFLFRDTTKNVGAISETKQSRAESFLTVLGNFSKTATLNKNAAFFAMYMSTSVKFEDYTFEITHSLVE